MSSQFETIRDNKNDLKIIYLKEAIKCKILMQKRFSQGNQCKVFALENERCRKQGNEINTFYNAYRCYDMF